MKIYGTNKKAKFEYELLDTFEAGIVLEGGEVKSIRDGRLSLRESYVKIEKNEIWLTGCHISVPACVPSFLRFDEKRDKKLLMHRKEITKLLSKVKEKGLTLIVTRVYQPNNSKKIKCEVALAKGKRTFDKKQAIRERDISREMDREIKRYR